MKLSQLPSPTLTLPRVAGEGMGEGRLRFH